MYSNVEINRETGSLSHVLEAEIASFNWRAFIDLCVCVWSEEK